MKKHSLAVVALCAMAIGAAAAYSAQQPQPEQDALKLCRAWLEAESKGDLAALGRILADDFMGMTFSGTIVAKHDVVPADETPHPRMPGASPKETTVRVFGKTAVVMGRVELGAQNPLGGFRFTLVLVDRGSGWQIVAAHFMRPPAEE